MGKDNYLTISIYGYRYSQNTVGKRGEMGGKGV
jgi:hypothetical protein